ncbi:3-deoxy-D-manno-octulosonic acid kinase [Hydrogenophaga sp.]|uniref:3-deoxy-D-manno-octulosonic acid kinase n=1 Tax=Hydrogenophaga sp. TaxID=1904254 RepID=UPI00271F6591|nr:3-deoxy-D-manno-octulosonic acid kinase [Hydrogenophaga sp.]MDO9434650.1 3-deoxy-D-manno-octulosonic acid kinase [Hydrogenophaga sp.]
MGVRPLALSGVSGPQRAYRLVSRALTLPLLGWLWWRGRREPGYRQNFRQRLGFIPIEPEAFGCIWVHAASVGEVQAVQPLLHALLREWPAHAIVVSTQTPTGARALEAHWGDRLRHVFAPIDTPGAVTRFLNRLQPRLLVLVERELWPEWLQQCRAHAVPVALVNARLSDGSVHTYQRWHRLMQPVWPQLTVLAADTESAARFRTLGVPAQQLHDTGNLKFDVAVPAARTALPPELEGRTLIVAGSTHEGDETVWLDAWATLSPAHPEWLLVLVPRHPQRFDDAARLVQSRGFRCVRRSSGETPGPDTQVLLIDAMGELLHWYQHAALCFVGGTLAPVGGHNPLEPMSVGQPVLFGPHTHNAAALFSEIERTEAGTCVRNARELADAVQQWLTQPAVREARAIAARQLIARHQGASDRSLAVLRPMWQPARSGHVSRVSTAVLPDRSCWFDPAHLNGVSAQTFDPAAHANSTALATGSGRGQALLIHAGGRGHVLRHYRRGGLVARLSDDRFWRTAAHDSRAMREFSLLRLMRSWELPVPEPVAASHRPRGAFFYEADILVGLIPDSANVVQHLQRRALASSEWTALGHAIRRLHDRQVFHADLNAHNLLLDGSGRAWVVDFDKCELRAGDAWKVRNLDRLLRSLRKEAGRVSPYHWTEADWATLMAGYQHFSPSP